MTKQIKLRFFLDTEFNDNAKRFFIDPISISLVPEDHAREDFYAVSSEFDNAQVAKKPWLVENVIKHLPPPSARASNAEIRDQIMDYFKSFKDDDVEITGVEIWALNGSTDNTVLANFFGGLMGLRQAFKEAGLPQPVNRDMNELIRATGQKLPPPENAHDCHVDALWTREMFEFEKKLLTKGQRFLVQ